MSNKHALYIISNYKFHKHTTLDRAQREMARLQSKYKDDVFRIYAVLPKTTKTGDRADPTTKHDKTIDYKNPPNQKGVIRQHLEDIEKPKLAILSLGGKNGLV